MLRRLYVIVSTMLKESIHALVTFNAELAKQTIPREGEIDKVCFLILRLLMSGQEDRDVMSKLGIDDSQLTIGYNAVANLLERIGDWAENLARYAIQLEPCKDAIDKETMKEIGMVGSSAQDMLRRAMESLLSGSIREANSVASQYEEQIGDTHGGLMPNPVSDDMHSTYAPQLSCVLFGVRRTAELASEISEIAVNCALTKSNRFCELKRGGQLVRHETPRGGG